MCVIRLQRQREREKDKESARVSVKGAQEGWTASNLWLSRVAKNWSQQEDTVI